MLPTTTVAYAQLRTPAKQDKQARKTVSMANKINKKVKERSFFNEGYIYKNSFNLVELQFSYYFN